MGCSIQKIIVICIFISSVFAPGCSVVHNTWLSESEITEIVILDPVYDPKQKDFYYSKQLQDIVYQMVVAPPEKSVRIINADWLIHHQKIFNIWKILDKSQQIDSLDFDNQSIYERLEPFEIFKTDRVLLLRIGLEKSDQKRLILDGYRLVKIFEDAVDINYFKTPLAVNDLSDSIKTAVTNLMLSMKYASPDFFSLGFEKVKSGCYRDKFGEESCLEDYYISRFPVTEKQWQIVMEKKETKATPEGKTAELRPMYPKTYVTWNQVQLFLERLNDLTNGNYLLPTIAEWEYACLKLGENSQGNFSGNNGSDKWLSIAPVNVFPMGKINIADLPGNTWEWTSDKYASQNKNIVFQWLSFLSSSNAMVLKGGSFDSPSISNTCFTEMKLNPNMSMIDIGFRLIWEPES
jgi:hypothetical protein